MSTKGVFFPCRLLVIYAARAEVPDERRGKACCAVLRVYFSLRFSCARTEKRAKVQKYEKDGRTVRSPPPFILVVVRWERGGGSSSNSQHRPCCCSRFPKTAAAAEYTSSSSIRTHTLRVRPGFVRSNRRAVPVPTYKLKDAAYK